MKNKIEYYYRIENINLHEQNNIYNFLYNNKKYIFFIGGISRRSEIPKKSKIYTISKCSKYVR